jgi:hypothetical protein
MIARISFREDVMLDTADAVHFTPTNEPSPEKSSRNVAFRKERSRVHREHGIYPEATP